MKKLPIELVNIIFKDCNSFILITCIQYVCMKWNTLAKQHILKQMKSTENKPRLLRQLCVYGKCKDVKLFLELNNITRNIIQDLYYNTYMYAHMCKHGKLKTLKFLIFKYDVGVIFSMADDWDYRALKLSCMHNKVKVVKWLPSFHGFINDELIETLELCRYHKKPDIAKMLVKRYKIYVKSLIVEQNDEYLSLKVRNWLQKYFIIKICDFDSDTKCYTDCYLSISK